MKTLNIIDKIDQSFYNKSKQDIALTYFLAVLVIGFIFFYFIIPQIRAYKISEYNKNISLKTQKRTLINENRVLSTQILTKNKTIKQLAIQKNLLIKQKTYFNELSDLLNFIDFNKEKWSKFVKNLVKNAQKEGLKVESFSNIIFNNKKVKGINEKVMFTVKLKGTYKNFIYFLYLYENRKDLLRVTGISMDSKREYVVNFVMYGYEK